MIHTQTFENLGAFQNEWLNAHYHFSFAGYRDPNRMGMGKLLVWNDDTIQPHTGFDPHPHRDMEIITYVRKGAITHKDSLGNQGRTVAGDVQVMSAGTGIVHGEWNLEDEETTIFQIWIEPNEYGKAPRWDTREFPKNADEGGLKILASGREEHKDTGAPQIYQDASLHGGTLKAGESVTLKLAKGRKVYVVPPVGDLEINGHDAPLRSGTMITDEDEITITAKTDAEVVVVDVP